MSLILLNHTLKKENLELKARLREMALLAAKWQTIAADRLSELEALKRSEPIPNSGITEPVSHLNT